ncbi:hypothetical protein Tco_1220537 [Tanacetum coccineum]
MRTRSQTRNRNRRQQQQTLPVVVEPCNLEEPILGQTIVAMADRTMEELLRAPTEGFPSDDFSNAIPFDRPEPFTSEFTLEEIDAYLYDKSISLESDHDDCDPEEDIYVLEQLLNDDPFQLPLMDLKQSEVTEAKSSIEEPPELELKDLPSHLEYAFLEENDKLPIIIAKGLKNDQKEALINVLKSHKRAIAWKITDIKGIDPRFCTHKILMEDDCKPSVQSQRTFLQNILDLYFKHFKLPEDVVNRILQVVLDLQHFKSSLSINGFDMPLPVAVCSGLVNPFGTRKDKVTANHTTYLQVVNHRTDLRSLYQEPFAPGLASSYVD